ncbi:DUF2285 domain-containing protein [Caulobacter segnis]|uniref:T6SS Transcription factor RovC-like DNA binding domain-containing protein n=1 Tax=Caulobacter segnis (strain ATCC 21756 / DSM 7131 / JCM 7823 / NBRC 15250 / LMG 17158 / TK0059) TaxID=509190 RepID=D5VKI9_CAUST|nr:DUF2285 domain-containing protein [Caulobacter segnis]ADG11012.1 Protein of unknown function DUF2285 [Caulobacter segnis ATCC 21756]
MFWLPEVAPGLVLHLDAENPADAVGAARTLPDGQVIRAEDGLYLRTSCGLQVLLRKGAEVGGPLVISLAFDANLGLRVRAVDAFERLSAGRPPPKSHLTQAQFVRLGRCLQALDAALAGLSYRAIASTVFGPAATESVPWKTAALRATTIRLVGAGRALMNGGYLKLLKGGL